jgi:hypothetical protein
MVEGLPPDGALGRAANGHHWQQETYLLADLRDRITDLFVAFLNANRTENAPLVPYPKPFWRPGDPTPGQSSKKTRKRVKRAREGYRDIVAQVTPEYAEKG